MKVIVPQAIDLESTNVAANSEATWSNATTYALGDLVKVTDIFPNTVYRSLRSTNLNRYPPTHLEPLTETATSTTSIALGTGSKSFTTQSGKAFSAGMMVKISQSVTPNSYNMTGEVTSYTSTTLVVNVTSSTGTGTFTSWTIETIDAIGFWEEVEATNQHKMFDQYVNTKTVNLNSIEVELNTTRADGVAIFGLTGKTVELELWDPDAEAVSQWANVVTYIRPTQAAASDNFGQGLAISGDGYVMAISSPNSDTLASNAGEVFIFTWDGLEFKYSQSVLASDGVADDQFGRSLALSYDGSILVVGCSEKDIVGTNSGQVYIYDLVVGTYQERLRLQAPDAADGDSFGNSVSISGAGLYLVVGAVYHDVAASNAGAAYVFRWRTDSFVLHQMLYASDAAASDGYGKGVAISSDGMVIAVGAHAEDTAASNAGQVYIYDYVGSTFTERLKLRAADAIASDYFGNVVQLSSDGSVLLVGAYGTEAGALESVGHLYLYDWTDPSYVFREKVTSAVPAEYDYFGRAAAMSADTKIILASKYNENVYFTSDGRVYGYFAPRPFWRSVHDLAYGSAVASGISDWYEYFFGEYAYKEDIFDEMSVVAYEGLLKINIIAETGTNAECGAVIVGRSQLLGSTQYGVSVGMLDFSYRDTDDQGRATVVPGYWAKTNSMTLYLDNTKVDSVYTSLVSIRGVPTAWIGNNDGTSYESLVVYGIFKDFSITVEGPSHSWCDLTIEGLI
jgi:hypothetical protein